MTATSCHRKLAPILIFFFTFLLTLFLSLPWVSAQEETKPKPQPWQIDGIVAALADPYAQTRLAAARKLAEYQLDDPKSHIPNYQDVVGRLVKQLSPEDKEDKQEKSVSRSTAAKALGQMQAKDQVPKIVALLTDSNSDVRSAAAKALGQMQAKDQVPKIVALLTDSNSDVLRAAAKALGQMQAKDQVLKIVALLTDSNSDVRSTAAYALGQMQAKDQVLKIAALLTDSNYFVLRAAAKALGQMQAKDQVPKIVALLKHSELVVRSAAAEALGQMQAKDQVPKIVALLTDSNSDVRSTAAEALGQMQAKDQVPKIVALLTDSNSDVRSTAAEALGQMQAKDQVPKIAALLTDSNYFVRSAAAEALGQMQAKDQVLKIAALLTDSDSFVLSAAAKALGQMQAKDQVPKIAALLTDSVNFVRSAASEALAKLGKQDLPILVQVLNAVHKYPSEVGQFRFLAHFIGGGEQDLETLIQWLGQPKTTPTDLTPDQGRIIMELFDQTWKLSDSLPDLQEELAQQTAVVADLVHWQAKDIILLQRHHQTLEKANYKAADTVQRVINNLEFWKWFFLFLKIILVHLALWLALILAYPKFPQILATCFWNPWVRRILGFGYIGLLLTWVPWLRRRLLQPFKPLLLADAGLDSFIEQAYFSESDVKVPRGSTPALTPPMLKVFPSLLPVTERLRRVLAGRFRGVQPKTDSTDNIPPEIQPITQALPTLQGQIVLEGDSGLGKSMFLRHLVKNSHNNSQRIVVYLPAQKCDKGVIEAIYAKLPGQAKDAKFLKNLIYSGAIDICIDGLNEVTADTRAKISQFAESYFWGYMIMTTQPLEWTPPSTAKKYELQPLQREQIQQFLLSRHLRLPQHATLKHTEYEQACSRYIAKAFNEQQSSEDLAAAKRILSNPMDLTLVALMLSQDKQPNLFRLQEQQYQLMAEEYQRERKHEFPLKRFSQAVYQMRLDDESAIPADEFKQELTSMEDEKYKMVVSRQWENNKGESQKSWYFRHDKIMEFFLVQNFCGEGEEVQKRVNKHIHDPRFRGVYLLLANLFPLDAALELRERLIEYAANTKDHTLSDKVIQLLKLRFPQLSQDGTFKQLLQQHEQKTQCLELVAKFLEQVDAKIKREKELYLTIESIETTLSTYTPFPVLITVDTPTDQDVMRLVQIS